MRTTTLLFRLLLLPLATPTWAQPAPVVSEPPPRPLNLTLPRDVVQSERPAFLATSGDDTATRNVRSSAVDGFGSHAASMPYGSGYEARQRARTSAGGFGRVGGGRGGMGRGR